ncbi:hypothetical protein IID24_05610 [Patescibacteria group bacterium]|nr:hypothetical protein [Patescibacteria group bacterium]
MIKFFGLGLILSIMIGGIVFFLITIRPSIDTTRPSVDEVVLRLDKIESSQRSLIEALHQTEMFLEQGQGKEAYDALDAFDEELYEFFVLSSNKKEIERGVVGSEEKIERIRKAEWEVYHMFYDKKEMFSQAPELIQKWSDIEKRITEKLKDSMVSAAEVMSLEYWEEIQGQQGSWMPIPAVFAQEPLAPQVIYIARYPDPIDPGSTGCFNFSCSKYESWAELSTGNLREQDRINAAGSSIIEINITSGESGKELALDPVNKRAEWLNPQEGKFGLSGGKDASLNPFEMFQQQLQSEQYEMKGTEIIDGQEVYVLKQTVYKLDFNMIYVSAATYLPIREILYREIIEVTPAGVIHTGEIEKNTNIIIEGKFIKRSELPLDFFELKIPDGYRLEDFVPFG